MMWTVRTLPEFDLWLDSVRDPSSRRRLIVRLRKLSLGLLGDVSPVGAGVWELREHSGPGWRMYYTQRGGQIVVLLGGGTKSSQRKDIETAKRRAASIAPG